MALTLNEMKYRSNSCWSCVGSGWASRTCIKVRMEARKVVGTYTLAISFIMMESNTLLTISPLSTSHFFSNLLSVVMSFSFLPGSFPSRLQSRNLWQSESLPCRFSQAWRLPSGIGPELMDRSFSSMGAVLARIVGSREDSAMSSSVRDMH